MSPESRTARMCSTISLTMVMVVTMLFVTCTAAPTLIIPNIMAGGGSSKSGSRSGGSSSGKGDDVGLFNGLGSYDLLDDEWRSGDSDVDDDDDDDDEEEDDNDDVNEEDIDDSADNDNDGDDVELSDTHELNTEPSMENGRRLSQRTIKQFIGEIILMKQIIISLLKRQQQQRQQQSQQQQHQQQEQTQSQKQQRFLLSHGVNKVENENNLPEKKLSSYQQGWERFEKLENMVNKGIKSLIKQIKLSLLEPSKHDDDENKITLRRNHQRRNKKHNHEKNLRKLSEVHSHLLKHYQTLTKQDRDHQRPRPRRHKRHESQPINNLVASGFDCWFELCMSLNLSNCVVE
ncbi:hypothetical protein HELRODRAFT_193258 [Helobdella robusta]|uniref:Uncharacterized protein n=1 Tax=Helobdella robusta TaxID=6412 RepID=T1FUT0_HELRO|nr:hypothetical protein HELRODRAFT_193258 [Helobdella robusta]ESN97312.1 hypothetical protein HELRODRAFT_193258 [Helobdella robusta]